MSAKAPAKGHTVKHTKTSKAGKASAKHRPNHHKKPATAKAPGHKVTAKAKHPAHAKAVGFAVGDLLPVCAFEAVAMSARLAGARVCDDDTAELWHLLGERPEGVPVGEALAAAALFGLGGYRPLCAGAVRLVRDAAAPLEDDVAVDDQRPVRVAPDRRTGGQDDGEVVAAAAGLEHVASGVAGGVIGLSDLPADPSQILCVEGGYGHSRRRPLVGHSLILHVDVPGPHAVLATADGWWSWGELYDPWPCRVSEAWAVSWS